MVKKSRSWTLPNLSETNVVGFLITIGSISFVYEKWWWVTLDIVDLVPRTIEPKDRQCIAKSLKLFLQVKIWFFWIYTNCVELFSGLSSSTLITTHWLRSWFSVFKIRASSLSIAVWICSDLFFIWAVLCVVKISKASMKADGKSRSLGPQEKMNSCIKLDDIETKNYVCSPLRVFVSISWKVPFSAHVDSKSKTAMLIKSFCLSV